jgi:hypothetical protein
MWLVEKLMPQSYHLWDYVWTPLRQNPCWNDDTCFDLLIARIATCCAAMQCKRIRWKTKIPCILPRFGTRYCKHESSLCATICWDSTFVPRFVYKSLPTLTSFFKLRLEACFKDNNLVHSSFWLPKEKTELTIFFYWDIFFDKPNLAKASGLPPPSLLGT